jgi:phosphopantothenoylcysteine decarboxylase/phosphopantothenate--cysteine ligase
VALGVTGCIAAYKAVEVLRGLQKHGVTVQVVMSEHATYFVTPLTFQAVSGQPVITSMWAQTEDPQIKHIQIAQSIDLLLVAPATANELAKFSNGIADDFLSTLYISTTAPVLVAPAMNVEMWLHPATQANVARLRQRGVQFVDPEEGYLACRTVGPGRLAEPERIVAQAWQLLTEHRPPGCDFKGERVLVSAGPTYEAIDPVRGITNRSSGRMGYAVAEAALARGAEVTLVSGPVALKPPSGARVISVQSAAEMYESVMKHVGDATVAVMAAAVADYRPVQRADQKMKKNGKRLVVELEPTQDILAAIGQDKGGRVVIGFAAETEDVIANARKKLIDKRADLIVANDVSEANSGFDVDTNRITIISSDRVDELPLMSKREAAERILDAALAIRLKRAAAKVDPEQV